MPKKSSAPKAKSEYVLVLPDIRSIINVGALMRTADAVGISRVIMCGYTPTPIDRFGRLRQDFAKAALGAENTVAWEHAASPTVAIRNLKKDGFVVVGVEQSAHSVDYKRVRRTPRMAFVMGTETTGIAKSILKRCDVVAEIPMHGGKESLNVSVAAGIVLYRILDQ